MATVSQRTTALALLVWYVTLSAGGYGLHDLLGSCHAPQCHGGLVHEIHLSSPALPLSMLTPEKGGEQLAPPRSTNCCSFHSCRRIVRTASVPSGRHPSQIDSPASSGDSPISASTDFVVWQGDQDLCPLCQWLGQLSIPTPFTPAVLDQALQVAFSAHAVTLVLPPTWRPFAPRGPPAPWESTCAPSNYDWFSRVGGTDVQVAGSPLATS